MPKVAARGVSAAASKKLKQKLKPSKPKPRRIYSTKRGKMYQSTIEEFLRSDLASDLRGQVKLIFTSPPFPLNRKKRYGNLKGQDYVRWLANLAPKFRDLLTEDGSIVIEVGNSWNPGEPTMSTLAIEALLQFRKKGKFHLCQQFICQNPARLPSPAPIGLRASSRSARTRRAKGSAVELGPSPPGRLLPSAEYQGPKGIWGQVLHLNIGNNVRQTTVYRHRSPGFLT